MAFEIVIVPSARNDIADALDYIVADSHEAARRWYEGLKESIFSLAEFPARCAIIPEAEELGIELRHLHYHSHRIVFRLKESDKVVEVPRVYHGARKGITPNDL